MLCQLYLTMCQVATPFPVGLARPASPPTRLVGERRNGDQSAHA